MILTLQHGVPMVRLRLRYGISSVEVADVVLDTGSATTLFRTDILEQLGAGLTPEDTVVPVRGIGGVEYVVEKQIDELILGERSLDGVVIEAGLVGYGLEIDGILGMDVLTRMGAVIDLSNRTLTFHGRQDET